MPRLFVAVWPPAEVLERVASLPRPALAGLRWTRPEQWHVTLRFLGSVDEVDAVAAAVAGAASSCPPLEAVAGPELSRFGQRVLHVPVAGLEPLAAAVIEATAALGQPPEDRPFAGHLTLARVARGARVDLRELAGEPVSGRWRVTEVCLVESRLHRQGARYEVVERFGLAQ